MSNYSNAANFGGSGFYCNEQGGYRHKGRGRGRGRRGQNELNPGANDFHPRNPSTDNQNWPVGQPQRYQAGLSPPSGRPGYPAHIPTHDTQFRPYQGRYFNQQQNSTFQQSYVEPQVYIGRNGSGQQQWKGRTNESKGVEDWDSEMASNTKHKTEESPTVDNPNATYQRGRQSRDNLQDHERDQSPDREGFQGHGKTGHSGRHFAKDSKHERDPSLDRSDSHHNKQYYRSPPSRDGSKKEFQTSKYDRRENSEDCYNKNDGRHYGNRNRGKHQREDRRSGRQSYERWNNGVRSPGSYQGNSSDCVSPPSDGHSPRRRLRDIDPVIHLSKTLSFILRHGAKRHNFNMMQGGFLYVEDILKLNDLQSYTVNDVKSVVENNDKQRFALEVDKESGKLKIRANQGHSIDVEGLELKPILKAEDAPVVIHGTYHNSWEIIKTEGLHKMGRNHIHFAAGEPGESGVISGMRSTCEVMIKIDLEKALKDGIKFFRSANNVILSPGDKKGYIYPCYFESAVKRSPYHILDFNQNISSEDVAAKIPGLPVNKAVKKSKKKKSNKNKLRQDQETKQDEEGVREDPEDLISQTSLLYEDNPTPEYWDEDTSESSAKGVIDVTESEQPPEVWEEEDEDQEDVQVKEKELKKQLSGEKDEMSTVEISDPELCLSAVHFLKTQKAVAIYCHISDDDDDGTLKNIICVVDKQAYNFKLIDILMAEGGLNKFFSEKQPLKIFHGIAMPAKVLLHEYKILLDGTDVSDTKILYEMVSNLPDVSLEVLKTLDFNADDWPSWDGNLEIFVKRCQVMLKAHDLMLSWLKNKLPKKEIFQEAGKLVDRTLFEEAKKAKKGTKKGKKNRS